MDDDSSQGRPLLVADINDYDDGPAPEAKGKCHYFTSLMIMSTSFFLVYTAFSAIQNLAGGYLGTAGDTAISVLYFVFAASCIAGPAVVDYLGQRWSLFAAFLTVCSFCVGNVVAMHNEDNSGLQYAVLLPTGALLGFGASFLWTAQGSYLTAAAGKYAMAAGQMEKAALGTFNGVFWGMFQLTQITGNLLQPIVEKATGSKSAVFLVYAACAVAGTLLIVFLPSISDKREAKPSRRASFEGPPAKIGSSSLNISREDDEEKEDKPVMDQFREVVALWFDPRLSILLPAIILSGFEQGFIWNDFSTNYVIPVLGKSNLGYVMACFGAADATGSLLMGKLSDVVGRVPVLVAGFLLQGTIITLFLIHGAPDSANLQPIYTWPHREGETGGWGMLLVSAFAWGLGDAVWNTQLSALLGDVFSKNTNPAFANFKLWQSLVVGAVFLYNAHVGTTLKQVIVAISLVTGAAGAVIGASRADKRSKDEAAQSLLTERV